MAGTGLFSVRAKIYDTTGDKDIVTDLGYGARIISVHAYHDAVASAVAAVNILVSTAVIVRLSSAQSTNQDPAVHQFRYPLSINLALDTLVPAVVSAGVTITNGGYVVILYTLDKS